MDLKDLIQKGQTYDDLVIATKGYALDSLIFRFKEYQSKAFQNEVNDYKYKHNCSETEARVRIQDRYDRDLMRFIEILDEVICKHD